MNPEVLKGILNSLNEATPFELAKIFSEIKKLTALKLDEYCKNCENQVNDLRTFAKENSL